ncbi:MAG: KamA family radical SAM protein [Deltaproteobacteria bacterium]|nr:MAG: KamA family radical SAM protein [Deltaproteobacteria bacterium]
MTLEHTASPAEAGEAPIHHLKPAVDPATLTWRTPRRDAFWQQIPAWRDVDHATFGDFLWQEKHAITSSKRLVDSVRELVSDDFIADVEAGFAQAPMAVRISPYLMSLIDWSAPHTDPIRRQFLPLASDLEPDHPMLTLDSLHEQADAPVPGLTHRYQDKALFLALDTCPVYCRFCTRSYAVGLDTEQVEKVQIKASKSRWDRAFQYLRERPEVEDVVISGGDAYRIKADQLLEIGETLLAIPHIRRFRVATKGLAILPMRIKAGDPWTEAVTTLSDKARKLGKDMAIHTHFGHANEITGFSEDMMRLFQERGVLVRNQAVLQRGVNDTDQAMLEMTRKLGFINVHPYYVYVCDMVRGVENLRTTVATALSLEKRLRGSTAGFNTPTFVVDAMGGGGKRDAHSYEHYDRETGISVYTAPSVKEGQLFFYYDPLSALSPDIQAAWQDAGKREEMLQAAIAAARANLR